MCSVWHAHKQGLLEDRREPGLGSGVKACVSDCVRGRIGHSGQGAPSSVVSQCESWAILGILYGYVKNPPQSLGVANSTVLLYSWTPWVWSQKRAGKGSSLLCGVWSLGRGLKWWRHRQLEGLDHFKSSFFMHTAGVCDGLANVSTWPLGHGVARIAELETQAQRASERSLRAGQKMDGHFYPHLRSHVASLPYTYVSGKRVGT